MSKPRNLNLYEVVETVCSNGIFKYTTHDILAPSDSVALEFIRCNLKGNFISLSMKNREVYIVDYKEIENEDNMETELKYQILPIKQDNKE